MTLKGTGLVATEDIAKALTTMLQDNTTLEYIDLSKNHNFADAGARCVCQGLQHNTTLLHLNLSSTRITDVGAEYIAQALKSNCSLQTLIISNNYCNYTRGLYLYRQITEGKHKFKPQVRPSKRNYQLQDTANGVHVHLILGKV